MCQQADSATPNFARALRPGSFAEAGAGRGTLGRTWAVVRRKAERTDATCARGAIARGSAQRSTLAAAADLGRAARDRTAVTGKPQARRWTAHGSTLRHERALPALLATRAHVAIARTARVEAGAAPPREDARAAGRSFVVARTRGQVLVERRELASGLCASRMATRRTRRKVGRREVAPMRKRAVPRVGVIETADAAGVIRMKACTVARGLPRVFVSIRGPAVQHARRMRAAVVGAAGDHDGERERPGGLHADCHEM